jgi:hypothetical protein
MRKFHFLDFFFTKGFYFLPGTWVSVFSICQFIWKQCVGSRSRGHTVRKIVIKRIGTQMNVLEYRQHDNTEKIEVQNQRFLNSRIGLF